MSNYLDRSYDEWSDPVAEEAYLTVAERKMIVYPTSVPKCVARTKRGARCAGLVVQLIWGHDTEVVVGPDGPVFVHLSWTTNVSESRIARQKCSRHHDSDPATDWCAPEWHYFDLERDARLISEDHDDEAMLSWRRYAQRG